jgi:hypothetical protein
MRGHAMGALKTTLKDIGYHTPPPGHAALRPPWSGARLTKKPKKIKTRNGKTDRLGQAAVAEGRAMEGLLLWV